MAFVFRSEKQSLFDKKKQDCVVENSEMISNEQSQLNGTGWGSQRDKKQANSPGKIVKGLPSLLRKDKTVQPDLLSFQKENQAIEQKKQASLKFNLQKLKRITENYFFSSKVPREVQLSPLKPLSKNLTCTQFSTNLDRLLQKPQPIKQIVPNHMASTFVVNRSLAGSQSVTDFRKTFKETLSKKFQAQKILLNGLQEDAQQFKRKCSFPQGLEKRSYNQFVKKMNELKQQKRQKSMENQTQIFMQTLNQLNKNSLRKNFTEKKIKNLPKGNLQSSFYKESDSQQSSSEQQISYQNDIPGPGSYDNAKNLKEKKSFRSKKQKFAKIFVSPLERFKDDQIKYHEVTYVNSNKKQKIQPNHVFVSRTPKDLQIEKRSSSPPIGSYDPRNTIEHDVVRNLLKSSNSPNFNSSLPRFKYTKLVPTPGPGYYNHDVLQRARQQQIKNQASSFYKSLVKRGIHENIKVHEQNEQKGVKLDAINDKQSQKLVIHKREQHFDSSEFFSPPPFFSSVQRFPESQDFDYQPISYKVTDKKIKNEQTKNPQPFNSSSKRQLSQKIGEGVGVGSYLVQKDRWNKKSYNVYFH